MCVDLQQSWGNQSEQVLEAIERAEAWNTRTRVDNWGGNGLEQWRTMMERDRSIDTDIHLANSGHACSPRSPSMI